MSGSQRGSEYSQAPGVHTLVPRLPLLRRAVESTKSPFHKLKRFFQRGQENLQLKNERKLQNNIFLEVGSPEEFWTMGIPKSEIPNDGIPIGVWRSVPSRIDQEARMTAEAMRISLGGKFIDVLRSLQVPESSEQWAQWINGNFPSFGEYQDLLRFSWGEEWQDMWQDRLQNPDLKNESLELGGILANKFFSGAKNSYKELVKTNPDLQTPQIVFTPFDWETTESSLAFRIESTNIIIFNTKMLENYSINEQNEIVYIFSSDGKPWHGTTSANIAFLAGREEVNHIDYAMRHGEALEFPLDPSEVRRAEYDAQPHEFRALRDNRRYVLTHPNEFPLPEDNSLGELEILNERIHEAIAVMRERKRHVPDDDFRE